MPPLHRLGACSRPLLSLYTAGLRSRGSQQRLFSSKISALYTAGFSSLARKNAQPCYRGSQQRLFSSKTALEQSSTIISSTKQQVHDFFQSITLFLPRVVAFCGTVHVTTTYGLSTVSCEGPSMEPTIIDGSFTCVLIDRFSHRIFGLEKNDDDDSNEKEEQLASSQKEGSDEEDYFNNTTWFDLMKGVWEQHFASGLQRGDVVILHHPTKEATICKRIIGIGGDTIVRTDGGSRESNHRVKVEPGHLWIEGDNTLQSHDSRAYGAVPSSLIIGKVVCRLWPLRDYASLGLDANGMEHFQRVRGRIGRGDRPLPLKKNERFEGSHVLRKRDC